MSVYTNAHTRQNPFCTFYDFSRTGLSPVVFRRPRPVTALYHPSTHDVFWNQGGVSACGRQTVQEAMGGVD